MESLYVYIPDCGHRIEVEALDSFVRATMDECRTGEFKVYQQKLWKKTYSGNIVSKM
jgi:hypothetical protein